MPGLESPDEIDLIAEDEDGRALLSIVQTGPWPTGRYVRAGLELKVSNYLRFALDGQMVAKYPVLQDRPVCLYRSTDARTFGQVRRAMTRALEAAEAGDEW